MIKHIIWDWNGTLLDDLDVSMEALNYVLEKENLPLVLDKEEYRKYFQFPVIEYYKKVGFDFNKTPFSVLAKQYMDYYQPNSLSCSLHKNVEETLQKVISKDVSQYLLSASTVSYTHLQDSALASSIMILWRFSTYHFIMIAGAITFVILKHKYTKERIKERGI